MIHLIHRCLIGFEHSGGVISFGGTWRFLLTRSEFPRPPLVLLEVLLTELLDVVVDDNEPPTTALCPAETSLLIFVDFVFIPVLTAASLAAAELLVTAAMEARGLNGGIVLLLECKYIGVNANDEEIVNNLCKRGIILGAASIVIGFSFFVSFSFSIFASFGFRCEVRMLAREDSLTYSSLHGTGFTVLKDE